MAGFLVSAESFWFLPDNVDQGLKDVATRLVEEIFQRVEVLAEHPDTGRVVPEFHQPFLRELIHPPFRIVYRRDFRRVRIVRAWRSESLLHLPCDGGVDSSVHESGRVET